MLSFTHAGNRLSSVQCWDGANLPQIGTFTYDAMGNQLTDSRKGLQFCYNLANLPSKVEGMAGSANAGLTLNYGYLSDGTKTSSIAGTGSSAEGLKYRGAFVYELKDGAERLSSVAWSDGRTEYVYAPSLVEDGDEVLEGPEELLEIDDLWYVPDHLGNVRAMVNMSSGGTVVEQNDYLPFGTRLANPAFEQYSNRYRLGGKEEQRFGGLDLALSDFGARFYDTFTARWTTRDPLAGKYHSLSPYNYCQNSPLNRFDPDGNAAHIAAGAIMGAVTGATIGGISALYQGKSGREFWSAVGGGAVEGAIEGAVFAATGGTGLVLRGAVVGSLSSAAGSIAEQLISNGTIETETTVMAGISGAAAGAISSRITGYIDNKSASMLTAIDNKYESGATQNAIRNEVKSEFRNGGRMLGKNGRTQLKEAVSERTKVLSKTDKLVVETGAKAVVIFQESSIGWGMNKLTEWIIAVH